MTSYDDGAGDAERGMWHRSSEPSATADPTEPPGDAVTEDPDDD